MPSGTGLDKFEARFIRKRSFDVGIAEQHAVTFAAGLADRRHTSPFTRDLFHLPAARDTIRSCTMSASRTCRSVSPSTAPVWSAPTARPIRRRIRRCLPRLFAEHGDHGRPPTRLELDPHGARRQASLRRLPVGAFRYPRGEGVGLETAGASVKFLCRSARAVIVQEGKQDCPAVASARALANAVEGCCRHAERAWACRPRWPMPASPSRMDHDLVRDLS